MTTNLRLIHDDGDSIDVKCPNCRRMIRLAKFDNGKPNTGVTITRSKDRYAIHPTFVVCMNRSGGTYCSFGNDVSILV